MNHQIKEKVKYFAELEEERKRKSEPFNRSQNSNHAPPYPKAKKEDLIFAMEDFEGESSSFPASLQTSSVKDDEGSLKTLFNQVSQLSQSFVQYQQTISQKFDSLDQRLEHINGRLTQLENTVTPARNSLGISKKTVLKEVLDMIDQEEPLSTEGPNPSQPEKSEQISQKKLQSPSSTRVDLQKQESLGNPSHSKVQSIIPSKSSERVYFSSPELQKKMNLPPDSFQQKINDLMTEISTTVETTEEDEMSISFSEDDLMQDISRRLLNQKQHQSAVVFDCEVDYFSQVPTHALTSVFAYAISTDRRIMFSLRLINKRVRTIVDQHFNVILTTLNKKDTFDSLIKFYNNLDLETVVWAIDLSHNRSVSSHRSFNFKKGTFATFYKKFEKEIRNWDYSCLVQRVLSSHNLQMIHKYEDTHFSLFVFDTIEQE